MHGPAIPPRSNPDRPRIDPPTIGRAYWTAIPAPRSRCTIRAPRSPRSRSGPPSNWG